MNNQEYLKTQDIGKLLIKFSIPAIIGMVVNALYNVIDRIFVGRIGVLAMTGIGLNLPIMTIIMAFGMLIGIGASSRISIRLGENNKEEAEKILGNSVSLTIIVMGIVAILSFIFRKNLLYLFGASESTIGYAESYIAIILAGSVFQALAFGLNHVIRASGNPRKSMYTMLIGAILNIILDPIFIFVFGMGIRGAALATIISQFVSMIWVLSYFKSDESVLKIRKEFFKLDFKIVQGIFSIGMAPFAMQIAASGVSAIVNQTLYVYGGDVAIGAMTVINSIAIFVLMPIFGINQGSQPIIGFNYGAKEYARVKKALKLAIIAGTAVSTTGFLLVFGFTKPLIQIFNSDPQLIEIATNGMRTMFMFLPIIGFQIVASNYFQAVGKAKISMFLSLLRQVTLLIPLLLILPNYFGLKGIWLSTPMADLGAAIITGLFIWNELRHLGKESIFQLKKTEALEINEI